MDEAPWSNLKSTIYSLLYPNPRSNKRIAGYVPMGATDRILDIGCGPGAAVRAAASIVAHATGTDPAPRMIEIARRRSRDYDNVEFLVGRAEALPFPDESFTVVFSISSAHHWSDRPAGLAEMLRVATPGAHGYVVERRSRGAHGLTESEAAEVAAEMTDAGWTSAAVSRAGKEIVVSAVKPAPT